MRTLINISFIATLSIFVLTACNNSDSNKISERDLQLQKRELDLKQKELDLKEKELTSKEKDSDNLKSDVQETPQKGTIQETQKIPSDTKILTLMSPAYREGDLPHLFFTDISTNKEEDYECNWDLPAIKEIERKCVNNDECPALKGKLYTATLKLKLLDAVEYDYEYGGMKSTGKKEKRWVMIALEKNKQ